jgi:glycosyltransferase involved in cell wall biosynthesis
MTTMTPHARYRREDGGEPLGIVTGSRGPDEQAGRKLNVWIFNHYAEPPTGMATRTFDLARELVRRGHRITIFASSFSHYRLREERIGRWWSLCTTDVYDGVRFVWLRTFPYQRNNWRRVLNMAGFGVLACLRGLGSLECPDAVIGVSVHPCAAVAGLMVAHVKGARFFVEVPDLWPQVLIDFGRIRADGLLAATLRWIERLLFNQAERILTLWRNTDTYIGSCGIRTEKIVWIPHAIDRSRYSTLPTPQLNGGDFTVMYLGSFVESMALDLILDAALLIQNAGHHDIRFVLVGGGVEKRRLQARATSVGLKNLKILDAVPKTEVPMVMGKADAFVCCLKKSPVFKYGISMNKLCDYLFSGRPTIFAGESAYDPVAEASAGISIRGDDPPALAAAIIKLAGLPYGERLEMGRNGIAWIRRYHELGALTDRLEAVLTRQYEMDGRSACQ